MQDLCARLVCETCLKDQRVLLHAPLVIRELKVLARRLNRAALHERHVVRVLERHLVLILVLSVWLLSAVQPVLRHALELLG